MANYTSDSSRLCAEPFDRVEAVAESDLLVDCLSRLEGTNISYMLAGSMAGNYWGFRRSTHDIDFVIDERKVANLSQPLSVNKRRTLTLDNGKELATHCKVSQRLEMNIYFAHPYCSRERGTNENTNGLIRQFIPKGTDLYFVSHQKVAQFVSEGRSLSHSTS